MTPSSSSPPTAPWLSVLIPVYNVQDYLTACVQSVVDQSADDAAGVEVLVLDDCSTDESAELMQSLAERWPGRLQLLQHTANAGLSTARNTMIDHARGEYLWFLDSDDKLLPGAIAGLRRIVQRHAVDMVLCDFRVWRKRERIKHVLRGERHRATFDGPSGGPQDGGDALAAGLLMTGQLHAWSKISRRALWSGGLRFPAGRYFEDMATMPQAARRARSFYYAPQAWVAYRQRDGSILSSTSVRKATDQSGALLAFAAERAALQPPEPLPGGLRFALAHQCARNLAGAMRSLQRIGAAEPLDVRQAAAARFRSDFDTASPLPLAALRWQYLRRGWLLRAARLGRWYAWQPR